MSIKERRQYKVIAAVAAGGLVWLVSSLADIALLPVDRVLLTRQLVANFIGGLVAVVVSLVLQLRHEEVHYRVAMDRAAIVAELNHHIRNAVFPLRIAVQTLGNTEANKTADDAIERINIGVNEGEPDCLETRGAHGQLVRVGLNDPAAASTGDAELVHGEINTADLPAAIAQSSCRKSGPTSNLDNEITRGLREFSKLFQRRVRSLGNSRLLSLVPPGETLILRFGHQRDSARSDFGGLPENPR